MPAIKPHVKIKIFKNSGGKCFYCKTQLIPFYVNYQRANTFTIDHFNPHSRGGGNNHNNLVACCLKCNQDKADTPGKDYLKSKSQTYLILLSFT